MDDALRALCEGLIDYAGLFPPAGLDMEPAARNYAAYRGCEDAWMLARFVVPAARVPELLPHVPDDGAPYDLTVLARPDALAEDALVPGAGSFELRFPDALVAQDDASATAAWIRQAGSELVGAEDRPRPFFLEAAVDGRLATLVAGIAAAREDGIPAGFKVRTGGLEPQAFPSSADVARVVLACLGADVPFKATAGLHHPLRRFDAEIGAHMHGFLNLFGGAALAAVHGLEHGELVELLEDEQASSWRFEEGHLHWRDRSASAADVRRARKQLATSFGSCSFEEPREDLRELGLL